MAEIVRPIAAPPIIAIQRCVLFAAIPKPTPNPQMAIASEPIVNSGSKLTDVPGS
jgi:hypothetical protein